LRYVGHVKKTLEKLETHLKFEPEDPQGENFRGIGVQERIILGMYVKKDTAV